MNRRLKKQKLMLIFLPFFIGAYLLMIAIQPTMFAMPPSHVVNHPLWNISLDEDIPEEQECRIPKFHPLDQSIWPYWKAPQPIRCKMRQKQLSWIDELNRVQLSLEATSYTCSYRTLSHQSGNDDTVLEGFSYPLQVGEPSPPILEESVKVECRNFLSITVYSYIHWVVPIKKKATQTPKNAQTNKNTPNVLIFGIDSMSRTSFMRHLPKTFMFLKNELNLTVLRGMNKIGDNTFPNLFALLTGQRAYLDMQLNDKGYFDDLPLLWKYYKQAGYTTFYMEDHTEYNTFNYLSKGFKEKPTDYYLRPFWLSVEGSGLRRLSAPLCYGGTPKHQLQLDYVEAFINKTNKPYFGFSFLVEISHDYQGQTTAADADFEQFFRRIQKHLINDNTLLIVLSDHGHRFDPVRLTYIGRLEQRLPFVGFRLPKSMQQYQKQLDKNVPRLTTPMDTYTTLRSIIPLDPNPAPVSPFGINLFQQNIPANRTCSTAGIPEEYCACTDETEQDIKDLQAPFVLQSAQTVLDHLNAILLEFNGRCANLAIQHIQSASFVVPLNKQNKIITNSTALVNQTIRILVEAAPSGGIFEATVINGTVIKDNLVSRVNRYGSQHKCIEHREYRQYCYCVKQ